MIVVALNGPAVLHRCLAALVGQAPAESGVEIMVVGDWRAYPEALAAVRGAFETVRWIDADGSTVPQRRSLGLGRARGDIVALLEDDCLVGDDWCRAVLQAHASPEPAIETPPIRREV